MTKASGIFTATTMALASTSGGSAFVLPQSGVHRRWSAASTTTTNTVTSSSSSGLHMAEESSAMDEVAALRAAAAKYREESNRLAKELGKPIIDTKSKKGSEAAVAAPVKKIRSREEILAVTSAIDFAAGDAASQSSTLNGLVDDGELSLWNSAAAADSTALRTFPVTVGFLETRSDGKITADSLGVDGSKQDVSLDDFKDATIAVAGGSFALAILSLIVLPDNTGAAFSYFFALLPIVYLGIGSSAPGLIAAAIAIFRGDNEPDSDRNDRICRHEAGHFLCGYLCGLPVKNYQITEEGFPCVEFHPSVDLDAINARRELTSEEIAALSVVAMSGSVAEVIELGQAKGGQNDLLELDGLFRRSKQFMGAAKQQDMTRWGALAAYNLLKSNKAKYEGLVDAFKEKKSVAECIAIVESS